jgi:hypothetical protein
MKKIIIISISLMLMGSVALAQNVSSGAVNSVNNNNINEIEIETVGNGDSVQTVQSEVKTQNQGEEQQIRTQEWVKTQVEKGINIIEAVQEKAKNVTELKEMIQIRKTEIEDELGALDDKISKVYLNQNKVREAVHTLLAAEDLVGGLGSEISEIAKEFNNSIVATVQAEEKIQKRNSFVKFFFGGDEQAATEIEGEVTRNQERIQQLNQLREDCNCTEEVKEVIQEQVQTMEQEQERLKVLAEGEKSVSGLFGWFKNMFKFGK